MELSNIPGRLNDGRNLSNSAIASLARSTSGAKIESIPSRMSLTL